MSRFGISRLTSDHTRISIDAAFYLIFLYLLHENSIPIICNPFDVFVMGLLSTFNDYIINDISTCSYRIFSYKSC